MVAIHNAGDSLLEILNDILDFSKLESGQLSLEQIAFSRRSPGPQYAEHHRSARLRKGADDPAVGDPALPPALIGDAGRIRQILLNLVSNAVKFTAAGEIVVSARCISQDDRQATIEWTVRDTGIGIANEKVGSLFVNFVQADNSISRRFGGSGPGSRSASGWSSKWAAISKWRRRWDGVRLSVSG